MARCSRASAGPARGAAPCATRGGSADAEQGRWTTTMQRSTMTARTLATTTEGHTVKRLALTIFLFAAAAMPAVAAPAARAAAPAAAPSSPDAVVQWNQFLLGLQTTPGVQ